MTSRALVALLLALVLTSCARPRQAIDAGPRDAGSSVDAARADGGTALPDAFVPGLDAFVPRVDAFVPGADAFVPPVDAFVPPVDAFAGTDAFVSRDAGVAADAFVGDAGPCVPLPAAATSVTGTIASGATYNRPFDCTSPSSIGTAVFYRTHVYCNTGATRDFDIGLEASGATPIADPFLAVYTGAGDVSSLACLATDDDSGIATGDAFATVSVPAGGTITIVATTYDNDDSGDYLLTIAPL